MKQKIILGCEAEANPTPFTYSWKHQTKEPICKYSFQIFEIKINIYCAPEKNYFIMNLALVKHIITAYILI